MTLPSNHTVVLEQLERDLRYNKVKPVTKTDRVRCGILFRWGSLWVGAHYSEHNRRWCINLIPCVTVWITLKGGQVPHG